MRQAILMLVVLLFIGLAPTSSFAAPRKKVVSHSRVISGYVSARLKSDRRALLVNFNNLGAVANISYILTYLHDGQEDGVSGTIQPNGKMTNSREFLFGTCSSGTCKYHKNISNMRLLTTTTLKNGKAVKKNFRVKV